MYLVELRPGKEELYRSVDELAAAIRCGDVDVHSRIFHRATSKWISITLHPQFKAIAAAKENEPLPPMPRKQWTFLTSAAEELESPPAGDAAAATPEADPSLDTSGSGNEPTANETGTTLWRRSAAFGFAGLLLILGVQVAFSVPRPEWPRFGVGGTEAKPNQQQPVAAPAAAPQPAAPPASSVVSLAGTAAWGQVGYPLPVDAGAGAPSHAPKQSVAIPAAPVVSSPAIESATGVASDEAASADAAPSDAVAANDAQSVETLIGHYNAAYDEARTRLQTVLPAVQLDQLFAPARLASADGVLALRNNIAGAANFLRAYQRRATEIEQAHQDTFAVLSRQLAWSSKQVLRWYDRSSRKESPAAVALGAELLASADSVLALLAANPTGYHVTDASVTFDRSELAAEYGRLRHQLEGRLASARAVRSEASASALATLLDALGAAHLPVEKAS